MAEEAEEIAEVAAKLAAKAAVKLAANVAAEVAAEVALVVEDDDEEDDVEKGGGGDGACGGGDGACEVNDRLLEKLLLLLSVLRLFDTFCCGLFVIRGRFKAGSSELFELLVVVSFPTKTFLNSSVLLLVLLYSTEVKVAISSHGTITESFEIFGSVFPVLFVVVRFCL